MKEVTVMRMSETSIKVRYVETDQMGIVHHSNYYAWFEVGRGDFITLSGIKYSDIEADGILFPLVESSCKYIEGARYDDQLTIHTWIEEMSPVKVTFKYNVIRKTDGKIIAKGRTIHTFISKEFKILNLKRKNPDIWSKLAALYEPDK